MPLESLKKISQDTWLHSGGGPSAGGICYYMCNFIESSQGIWNNPGSFANALTSARDFAQGSTMMSYARAQNLRKLEQEDLSSYAAVNGTLPVNRIIRIALEVGNNGGQPNHEMVAITGDNNDIVYFEPNFGFFRPSEVNMNNRQALEHFVNQQYVALGNGLTASHFVYHNVRANNKATPKGFGV